MKPFFTILAIIFTINLQAQTLYYPPVTGTTWDTMQPSSLGWCQVKIDSLISYLDQHNTKAFLILKDGKIVVEHYFGTFTVDSAAVWNSAGKSLTAFLTGLAQEQGALTIADSLPKYLHHPYSTCTIGAEDSIRIYHQLTMTTGFDDEYGGLGPGQENHCTADSCLVCIAAPGTRWAYHNAPYTMIHWVIDSATHQSMNTYTAVKLGTTCGITGLWLNNLPGNPYDEIFASKARSMARFGLLMLGKGNWNGTTIMHDTTYFHNMTNTSQLINRSYGYLWWLNGKASYHLPGYQVQVPGSMSPDAPADMISALGKNEQILDIVPSMGLVVVRMGNAFNATSSEISNVVNDSIWVKINALVCNQPAGVTGISNTASLKAYPNPAHGSFMIEIPGETFDVEVSDITGRLLFYSKTNLSKAIINCSVCNNGIYFIKATTNLHAVYNGKIMVE